ncbi:MAG: hypothetical protein RLZZ524_1409 [Pseudomonadota bacterium]
MDHLKPPSRLNVVLLSLPPRTQAVLDYFFSSTGRSSFAVTDPELAHAAIFDVDTLASRQHWDAWHAGTGRPGIAMSIQPQELPGTVWVRKPITPAALLHAAAELGAMRWHPMKAAEPAPSLVQPAAPEARIEVVAPTAPTVPVAPVAPVMPAAPVAIEPVQPVVAEVMAPAVSAPVPAPIPAAIPAEIPVVIAPSISAEPVQATPAPAVVEAPVAAPVMAPAAEPVIEVTAVVQAAPAAPAAHAARPAPVIESRAEEVVREPAQEATRTENRESARPAGIGGFLKRLFGAAPVPSPQPAQAAARPAVARATYPTGSAASASRAAAPVSPLGKAAMAASQPAPAPSVVEAAAPEPVVLGTASIAPATAPATPGAVRPVVVPLNKTHVRKRGRKGPTRWVDPNGVVQHGTRDGAAGDGAHPGTADDERDEAEDLDATGELAEEAADLTPHDPAQQAVNDAGSRPVMPAANDGATGAAAPTADAAVITLEAEPVVRIEPYGSDETGSAANADRGDDAAEPAPMAAGPSVVWRGLSSPTDQADEALYCGSRADAPIDTLQSDRSLRYDPSQSLVAALTEAYLIGRKWQVPTQFECSAGRVIVDSPRNRVLLGFDDARLAELLARGPERIKTLALNRHEQAALQLREGENWQPLDRLLWRAGLLQAQGRLPQGVDLKRPVYLKQWPNLTRVQRTPHAMRVAALWATRGAGLVETAELLKIPQRHVFAFYSAALAADLVTEDGSSVKRAQRRGARNRGLLTRLLGWLQA